MRRIVTTNSMLTSSSSKALLRALFGIIFISCLHPARGVDGGGEESAAGEEGNNFFERGRRFSDAESPASNRSARGQRRYEMSQDEQLMTSLFDNYDVNIRPVLDSQKSVAISIRLNVQEIMEMDSRLEVLKIMGTLQVEWVDERLMWDPELSGNRTELVLPPTRDIWLPRITIVNTASPDKFDAEYFSMFGARLRWNGSISWEPGGIMETMCQMDVSLYPFDKQECQIIFGEWLYVKKEINLITVGVNNNSRLENGEWQVTSITPSSQSKDQEDKPSIIFRLILERKSGYYVINLVLPAFLLSVLVLLVFYLPAESGEKVSLGVTLLLAFTVFQMIVLDNVPPTSAATPLIVVYLLACMTMSTVSVVVSIMVLRLHNTTTTSPPPEWICQTLGHIAHSKFLPSFGLKKSVCNYLRQPSEVLINEAVGVAMLGTSRRTSSSFGLPRPENNELVNIMKDIHKDFHQLRSDQRRQAEAEETREHWRNLARAIDMTFFYIFSVILVTLVIAVFIGVPLQKI